MRCAPRELALAKAHLAFAEVELDQGFASRASEHLAVADPNAHAAYDLSPPDKCSERALAIPATFDDPDTDGDGIADSRDMCILVPEDQDGYLDDDGCPEADNDLDAVNDPTDKCPNEPEDPDGFEDQDGCPENDNDRDTVVDLDDACPNEPGPADGERPGCKPSLVVITDGELRITQQIHFETGKDVIRKESFPVLDAVAEVLQRNPEMRIEVQGHTDNKGAAAYNLKLSGRRAASVRKYLVAKGIQGARLVSRGYGLTRPLVANTTEQNRALNRRVQFIRTEGGQSAPP